jgi:hypothetical protein
LKEKFTHGTREIKWKQMKHFIWNH